MEKKNAYEAISLRQKAEVRFKEKHSKKAATLTESETLKLLYELELHQIELEIQNDELRLAVHKAETANTLYDFSPAGYFTLDRDGAIFQLNLNGTKLLGLDRSFLVNSNIRTSISPDTLPVFIDFLKNVFKTNSKETCEVRLVTNGNPSHFVHLEGCLTPDEQKCLVTAVDISGQKQVEDQLLYRNILLSSQQEASLDGILVVDENKTIISYNRRFVELMGIPQALIENSADEPVLRFVTDQMVDPQQFIRNAQYLYDHRRETSKEELVLKDGRIFTRYSSPIFGPDDHYYGRAWYFSDITDRKRAELELLKKENQLKTIIDASPVSIWFKDNQNNFIRINKAAAKIANHLVEEVEGRSADEIFPAESAKYFKDDLDVIKSGKSKIGIIEPVNANGINSWVRTDKIPWYDADGNIAGIIAFALDITDRVVAEEALRESELLLRTLVQAIPDLIWLKDRNGVYLSCNTMFERFFGAREAEIIGKTDYDFVDRELADAFRENDCKAMTARKSTGNEEWITFADDGHRALLDITKTPIYDSAGMLVGVLGIGHDITKRNQTEVSLKESRQLFENLAQISPVGIFRTRADGYTTYVNPCWSDLSGLSFEAAMGYGWLNAVHPDDRELLINNWNSDINIEQSSHAEYRFLKPDGSIVWVIGNAVPEMKDKIVTGFIGTITDISERKKSEDVIRQERILLRTLIDNLPDTIYIKDNEGRKLIANSADLQMMNKTSEAEISGKTDLEIYGAEIGAPGYAEDMSVLQTGRPLINYEDSFTDTKGIEHCRLISKLPLYDEKRQIVGLVGLGHDITARKLSDESLKKSEERYRSIFENATMGIYRTSEKGQILLANPALVGMLGYERFDDLVTRNLENAGFELEYQRSEFRRRIERDGEVKDLEMAWKRKDNTTVHVRESARVFRDNEGRVLYYEGMVEDITEKKEVEKKVRLLAQSLESVSECVSITDNQNILIYINKSFIDTYGYTENELIGKHISILRTRDKEHEQVKDILRETLEGGWRGELMNKRKDGTVFPVSLSTSIIKDESERPVALIGVAIDITEMKEKREELIAAKEKAEESDRLKTAFLATMNHELRTPLNHILGFSELIISGVDSEDNISFAANIQSSGHNLLSIIEDVFDLAQVEQEHIKIRNQTFSLMEHFMENKASFDNILINSGKNEQISLVFHPDTRWLTSYLTADRSKINQVLTNLFKNAVKFTRHGTIEFGFKVEKETSMTYYVKDSGIGIPTEKQSIIFDFFRQGDDSSTRVYGGIGIGLAISQKITKILKGELKVVSEPGAGSTFSFTIPVQMSNHG